MTLPEKDRMDTMEEKLSSLETKVDRVLSALIGDELNTDKGLVSEFKILRERVAKLEGLKVKVIWIAVGAGIGGGLSLSKLIEWIQAYGILH